MYYCILNFKEKHLSNIITEKVVSRVTQELSSFLKNRRIYCRISSLNGTRYWWIIIKLSHNKISTLESNGSATKVRRINHLSEKNGL